MDGRAQPSWQGNWWRDSPRREIPKLGPVPTEYRLLTRGPDGFVLAPAETCFTSGNILLDLRRSVDQRDAPPGHGIRSDQGRGHLTLAPDVSPTLNRRSVPRGPKPPRPPSRAATVLVSGNGAVMSRMSERTTPQAVERLATDCSPRVGPLLIASTAEGQDFMHLATSCHGATGSSTKYAEWACCTPTRWSRRYRPAKRRYTDHRRRTLHRAIAPRLPAEITVLTTVQDVHRVARAMGRGDNVLGSKRAGRGLRAEMSPERLPRGTTHEVDHQSWQRDRPRPHGGPSLHELPDERDGRSLKRCQNVPLCNFAQRLRKVPKGPDVTRWRRPRGPRGFPREQLLKGMRQGALASRRLYWPGSGRRPRLTGRN